MAEKRIKISELKFDDQNANLGTARGRGMIEDSLQKYGAGRSILLDKNNKIICGNKTAEVAGGIGLENVRIIETTGDEIIAVKRTDLDLDKGGAARELAIADNRTAEVGIEWDPKNVKKTNWQSFFSAEEMDEIDGDETERLVEQEKNLEPYKKVHILISVDVDKLENVGDLIDQLRKKEGVEIEAKAN